MSESGITTVDYQTMQHRSLATIACEIQMIQKEVERTVLAGAIEIGNRLIEAKEMAGHGNFLPWCKENLNYSDRKAREFMQIAETYGNEESVFSKWRTSANISYSKALSLLALPEEDVEAFVEEHDIEEMSTRNIDEEVKKLKEEKAALQKINESMAAEIDLTNKSLEAMNEKMKNSINRADYEIEVADLKKKITDAEEAAKSVADTEKKKTDAIEKELERMRSSRQEDIDAAVAENREKIFEQAKAESQAEVDLLIKENSEMQDTIVSLESKLASGNTIQAFKVHSDLLQNAFKNCLDDIDVTQDEEMQGKMINALSTVLSNCDKKLEDLKKLIQKG